MGEVFEYSKDVKHDKAEIQKAIASIQNQWTGDFTDWIFGTLIITVHVVSDLIRCGVDIFCSLLMVLCYAVWMYRAIKLLVRHRELNMMRKAF